MIKELFKRMPVKNNDIAEIFEKIADLLEIDGENTFRIRAYRNAALIIENLSQNASDMVKRGEDLTKLPGIGKDLADKVSNIVKGKKPELLLQLEEKFPLEFTDLMRIQGLGPKKIKKLYDELKIKNIEELAQAAEAKKIRELPEFSAKTETHILEEIDKIQKKYNRIRISNADQYALPLVNYLKKNKNIKNIEVAGSYRRRQETIGDIDILVTCNKSTEIMDEFVNYEDVEQILSKGETRSSIILKAGIQVDLRAVPQKSYGAALNYFTGSKSHNIRLRKIAKQKGWKINEYGIFKGEKFIAGKTEEEIYKKFDLQYIPPELRENRGEIEAAEKGTLPKLIELSDIKGDLHVHTKATDGKNTLEEMVEAAQKMGYQYIANTEHSKHVSVARGLDIERLREQIKKVDKLNENLKDFTILKSIELDILEDGSLDLPDSIIKELDIVICAIHYKFNLPRQKQTERVLRAMDNPYFNIFAHPTGRLINEREPYDIDIEQIMKKAKENSCILELNSYPTRLDLNDIYCKAAKDKGIKIAISTDSHSTNGYENIRYGIGQARRGWLEAKDVINTRNINELKKILKRKY